MRKILSIGIIFATAGLFATASHANGQPQSSKVTPTLEQGTEAEPLCTGGGSTCKKDEECCSGKCTTDTQGFRWCSYQK